MEPITIEIDKEIFLQVTTRYSKEKLLNTLVDMCEKENLPITKENMESRMAALESDLQHMFA